MLRKSVTNRKLHNIDQQQFITDLKLQDLNLIQQPDELVNAFEDRVQMAVDKHAPEITKEITIRSTNPWFTNKVKDKKKAFRRSEKIWGKYKYPEHWRAFQVARKEYKILLTQVKTTKIKEKIDDCQKDTKKLYELVVYLTGTATENPLPPRKTDNQSETSKN